MKILITGGAGFVGADLAVQFKNRFPQSEVLALDNLKRRGSELNLPRLKKYQIKFVHGDIRNQNDFDDLPQNFDLIIDASAEPSIHAGTPQSSGSPRYVLDTNLSGTLNCLEFARKRAGKFIFLSTSRVYSIPKLRELCLEETESRFALKLGLELPGITGNGISESFPTDGFRSFYGSTKLASELFIQEYVQTYGLNAVINRCGVLAGPGQFGKVDQGVFTLWVANHYFKKPLKYTGFGGEGKQVRDLLHPSDLFTLLCLQLENSESFCGEIYNVGGGKENSISMKELTEHCRKITGNEIKIQSDPTTSSLDIPLYFTDLTKTKKNFKWEPLTSTQSILLETLGWIRENEKDLKNIFI